MAKGEALQLKDIGGIGPATIEKLAQLRVESVRELIQFFPTRYVDLSTVQDLSEELDGEYAIISVHVVTVYKPVSPRRGLTYFKVTGFSTGKTISLTFFNQPYYYAKFSAGVTYLCFGKIAKNNQVFEMVNPTFEPASAIKKLRGIVPIYPSRSLIPHTTLRQLITKAIEQYPFEWYGCTDSEKMRGTYMRIHNPPCLDNIPKDATRAAKDELMAIMFSHKVHLHASVKKAADYPCDSDTLQPFIASLPYTLTKTQTEAVGEIIYQLKQPYPMNRLLSGDVGSGKTIVAFCAVLFAAQCGHQSLLIAPTEILANQHYLLAKSLLEPFGVRVALLTSSVGAVATRQVLSGLASGEIQLLIGTTSLVSDRIRFADLALAVVDESHRFGVATRARLTQKGENIDVLIMTATPIPRSISLLTYGELSQCYVARRSAISESISTLCTSDEAQLCAVIGEQLAQGRQAYIVCPSVLDSEGNERASVFGTYERFVKQNFPTFNSGVLHGKMSQKEKDSVMGAFKDGQLNILVASTVVEVGIDVPNATVMCILDAQLFGLATLHQLRGRVGRGSAFSYCILYTQNEDNARLQTFARLSDGLDVAELDYSVRGAGEYIGYRQSGQVQTRILESYFTKDVINRARLAVDELPVNSAVIEEFTACDKYKESRVKSIVFN